MRSNYKKLGNYIQAIDHRNVDLKIDTLLGVSVKKVFIPSIANTVGTNFKKYKIVRHKQFTYIPDTSRRGDKIGLAMLENHDKVLVSQAYTVFEVIDHNELDPEYLMMWFRRPEFDRYARFKSHGSVREIFDWDEMCEVELPIPHIDQQREIVAEYNTVVNRIKLNETLNQKLEETAQAIYKEWFVDLNFPITKENCAELVLASPELEGKPYKSSGGKMVFNEELDKDVPEGWESDKVGNCIKYNYASYNKEDCYSSIAYLDTSSITNNRIDELQSLIIGVDKIPSRAKRKVTHNDIVYSTVRPNLKHFGIIKQPIDNMLVSTGFMVIQSIKESISSELIFMWLTNEEIIEYLHSKAEMSVSTYPSIKPEDIEGIDILIPKDKNLLWKVKKILSPIFDSQWQRNNENKYLEKCRSLLLSKMTKI